MVHDDSFNAWKVLPPISIHSEVGNTYFSVHMKGVSCATALESTFVDEDRSLAGPVSGSYFFQLLI
jgi:hypothetical protein